MISRYVYNHVGKLAQHKDAMFFMEDEDYANRVIDNGFKFGILKNVKVYHATGKIHNKEFSEVFENKMKDYEKVKDKSKDRKFSNLKRYYYKLLSYAEKEMNQN